MTVEGAQQNARRQQEGTRERGTSECVLPYADSNDGQIEKERREGCWGLPSSYWETLADADHPASTWAAQAILSTAQHITLHSLMDQDTSGRRPEEKAALATLQKLSRVLWKSCLLISRYPPSYSTTLLLHRELRGRRGRTLYSFPVASPPSKHVCTTPSRPQIPRLINWLAQ